MREFGFLFFFFLFQIPPFGLLPWLTFFVVLSGLGLILLSSDWNIFPSWSWTRGYALRVGPKMSARTFELTEVDTLSSHATSSFTPRVAQSDPCPCISTAYSWCITFTLSFPPIYSLQVWSELPGIPHQVYQEVPKQAKCPRGNLVAPIQVS